MLGSVLSTLLFISLLLTWKATERVSFSKNEIQKDHIKLEGRASEIKFYRDDSKTLQ